MGGCTINHAHEQAGKVDRDPQNAVTDAPPQDSNTIGQTEAPVPVMMHHQI